MRDENLKIYIVNINIRIKNFVEVCCLNFYSLIYFFFNKSYKWGIYLKLLYIISNMEMIKVDNREEFIIENVL